jgi:UDP-N-acetylglucosamine--N-acetylmuramyl-(pentapeptide) pyrophosphoryl-undecaprenol N-acetylglucosamine transferase
MRLLYSCSELGLGHASRTIALGKRLEARGHEVFYFTGGKAYLLLKKEFKHVYPITPIAWYENGNGINTTASLINIFVPLFYFDYDSNSFKTKPFIASEIVHRYYDLRDRIRQIRPDALIADGDILALRLAHKWKIPSIYITNLIRPSHGFSPLLGPGERLTEIYTNKCAKIIIPDNPSPYTICDYNMGDLASVGVKDKVEFVGSFFNTTPVSGQEKYIFAPVSGPFGTRAKLLQMLVPAFEKLGEKGVISLGIPGERKTGKRNGCIVHSWLTEQERQECMRNASIVVFSGGHITCFETIKYVKPSICIPTQPEQCANAAKLQDLQCSLIARNQEQIAAAIRKIESNYDYYKENVKELNRFTNKFDGIKRATEIIESIKPCA